jgi:hypothetical protein
MTMQRSDTKQEEQSPPRREPGAFLSPGRAFIILLAVLLVLGTAGYLFIDKDEPKSKPIAQGPAQPSDSKSNSGGLTNKP